MARTTYQTYLMYKATAEAEDYDKLIDIIDFPDTKGDPDMVDITTLSDDTEKQLTGITRAESKQFTANYSKADYIKLLALEGQTLPYALYFGADATGKPDGHDGIFESLGTLSVTVVGGGVNDSVKLRITLALQGKLEITTTEEEEEEEP